MKGGFELSLLLLFGMIFVLLSMSLVKVLVDYHQARFTQESIVALIEQHNGYDETVQLKVDELKKCTECTIAITLTHHQRYLVTVHFPIKIPVLLFSSSGVVRSLTFVVN